MVAALHIPVSFVLWFANVIQAQTPAATDKFTTKGLEAAVAYAQSQSQWQFILIGASLLLIVGNSHLALPNRLGRSVYLLFVPAWISLALSIYYGTRVQQAYLAYFFIPKETIENAEDTINAEMANEVFWMDAGLIALVVWLGFYLAWWIRRKDAVPASAAPTLVVTTTTSIAAPNSLAAPIAPPAVSVAAATPPTPPNPPTPAVNP